MSKINIKNQPANNFGDIWQAAEAKPELIEQHPYIKRKQIQSHGIRVSQNKYKLIVPLYDTNLNINGLQK